MSTTPGSQQFEALLDFLKQTRGVDLTGYKRTTLGRRVDRRMQAVGADGHGDYMDYLQVHPEEFGLLLDTILINVTSFFRDAPAWSELAQNVVPALLAAKGPDSGIRAWSAGCASGEETYTLAMVLAEALGTEAFARRVKIYGTDVDEHALSAARLAIYDAKAITAVPEELRERYLEKTNGSWVMRRDIRSAVVFGRHDLAADAPISRLDLLVCRNVLMYFNAETQDGILERFRFALSPGGFLFLGKAETRLTRSGAFRAFELKQRIFQKAARDEGPRVSSILPDDPGEQEVAESAGAAAFRAGPVAQLVVNPDGILAGANDRARALFRLAESDLGRPLQDLEVSYRPLELRSLIERAYAERRPVEAPHMIDWIDPTAGQRIMLGAAVTPLAASGDHHLLGVSISFFDETQHHRLEAELAAANRQLETAYEELQSTNEELETTNEELQSTIEELETTNEELQSTNEELETMNEELHSTNEEMQAVNDELRERGVELDQVNGYLESILTSLKAAVIVVDRDLLVRVWNRRAEDLWGLRADEVAGKGFLSLEIGLPVHGVGEPLRRVLSGAADHEETTLDAINRRGRQVRITVTTTPVSVGQAAGGAILLMEDEPA